MNDKELLKNILFVGMVVTLGALSGCSENSGTSTINAASPPTNSETTALGSVNSASGPGSSDAGSIVLKNIYTIGYVNGAIIGAELENNGDTHVKAFAGRWTMTDDLGDTVASYGIKYTSDTHFVTTNGEITAHAIAPGDDFVFVQQSIDETDFKTYAMKTEDFAKLANDFLPGKSLDDIKATKKTTFELEKIVSQ